MGEKTQGSVQKMKIIAAVLKDYAGVYASRLRISTSCNFTITEGC